MAQTATLTTAPRSIISILTAPFRALWAGLIGFAESSARMKALNHLYSLTDAQLAAMGRTRDGEIRRIIGLSYYL